MGDEEEIIRDTLRGFKAREIEALWEQLNRPERKTYEALWDGLAEVGVPSIGLPDELDGLSLSAQAELDVATELGAGCPSLAVGLLLHRCARTLAFEAAQGQGGLPAELVADAGRWSLVGSPLSTQPDGAFTLHHNGAVLVSGRARAVLPHARWLVLSAGLGESRKLVVLGGDDEDVEGIDFKLTPSSHGLCLLPFGELVLDHAVARFVFDWPEASQHVRVADGLLTAVLCGMLREMSQRACAYALERYQGGKMIHEHDTIREMVGRMLLLQRALEPLALDALCTADQSVAQSQPMACAFAVQLVRRAGLDAIQAFGGYGYMEDYRVERYLRDANTLETFFIHAATVARASAAAHFTTLLAQESR